MVLYGDLTFDSRVQREANSLVAAGHSVTIFCLAGSQATAAMLDPKVAIEVVTVGSRRGLPHTPSPFLDHGGLGRYATRATWLVTYVRNIVRWGRSIGRTASTFDVWHAHDFTGLLGASLARPRDSVLVYDLHDLHLETDTGARLPRPLRSLLRRYEGRLVRNAAAVITVNEGLADYERRHFQPRSVVVVHNCAPAWTPPEPPPTLIRTALDLAPVDPVVLYHGLLDAGRGLGVLVEAMREPGLEGAHLALLGFGPERDRLQELASRPPFGGRLHLLDAVPPSELMPWVASADVGVMPNEPRNLNDRLSTPNKLFESIAAGLPVVSSDFPERRRIILEDPDGPLGAVCDPTDPAALGRAIRSIIDLDPPARADLRRRCATAARERWNWGAEARTLVEAYARIAEVRTAALGR